MTFVFSIQKKSLTLGMALSLTFQPCVQGLGQTAPSYNQRSSHILAHDVNNKLDAILFIRDFNADPNVRDENGDTVLIKALKGELSDGILIGSGSSFNGFFVGFALAIFFNASFNVLFEFYRYKSAEEQLILQYQSIPVLFQGFADSGVHLNSFVFYRTTLDASFLHWTDKEAKSVLRTARQANASDKETVPDELLNIIEEYVSLSRIN